MPKTVWADTIINVDTTSAGQDVIPLDGGIGELDSRLAGFTLLRTIIRVDLAYVVHDSGEGSQTVFYGIGVGSQEAVSALTVPDPEIATEFPPKGWVWRAGYRVFGFAADQPVIDRRPIDLDLKSRRVLDNGRAYMVISNLTNEGTAGAVRSNGMIRMLWLLS